MRRPDRLRIDSDFRYRRVFEAAPDGILIIDAATGDILDVNPFLTGLLGYSRDELVGKKLWEVGAFSALGARRKTFKAWQKKEKGRFVKLDLKTTDGQPIQVEFAGQVCVEGDARVIQCLVHVPATRVQETESTTVSGDELRALFASMQDVVVVIDRSGVYRKIAPTNPGLLYEPPHQLLGKNLRDVFPEERAQALSEAINQVLNTKQTIGVEYELPIRGRPVCFATSISPMDDDNTLWVARDITDQKQAQTLQEAVYRIAAAAETTGSLDDLYPQIHQIISSVMPAENFYITIYDATQDLLRFPYFKDVDDRPFVEGVQPGKGLTAYVLRTGKSLLCTQAVHDNLERRGEVKLLGVPSAIWLGVPLIVEGRTIGAMVVQHYSDPKAYGKREQHMLEFVSTQVALAISRKQSEQAARAAEEKYRAIFENSIDGVFQSTVEGRFLTVNPAFARMLGYASPQDMIETVIDIARQIYVESPRRDEFVGSMAQHGRVTSFEFQMRCKDGGTLWVSENVHAVHDASGNLLYYEGTVVDITARKRTEAERLALLEIMQGLAAAKSLQEFLEHMRQSLARVLYARNLFVIFHNKGTGLFEEVFAVDQYDAPMPPSLLERSITAYVFRTGEPLLLTQAKFDDLLAQGEVNLVGTRQASWLGAPLKTPSETIGVIAVQNYEDPDCYSERDREFLAVIGAQVALAIERKRAEDSLRESEARYRAVTESANDAIISADSAGSIIGWNPAAEAMFGYSAAEVISLPLTRIMPANFQDDHLAGMARLQAGREPRVIGRTVELEGRRKDGTQFPLEFSVSDWQVGPGRFYTAMIHDITQRQNTQAELQRAKDLLETANRGLQLSLSREENLARKDALTGLRNRFNFDELAALEYRAAVRYHRTLSVMMLDADDLKGINDRLGHAAGDDALKLLAHAAALHSRVTDVLARYGGDEFVLLLPETTAQHAFVVAERIRASAATLPVGPSDQPVRLTLSIGIAELQREPMDEKIDQVLQRADKALYRAKTEGRDRAVVYDVRKEDDEAASTRM